MSLTPEVRCAVVGNVDSGKSTTLGVLTRGMSFICTSKLIYLTPYHNIGALDDGRGRARVGLFRHKHEIETGRTSSVGMEVCAFLITCSARSLIALIQILGFSPSGLPILPSTTNPVDPDVIRRERLGWDEITQRAAKVVSFIGAY